MRREIRHRLSVILNIVLAVPAVALALHRSAPAPAPSVAKAEPPPPPDHASPIAESPTPRFVETASAPERRRWLVEQLRAMGVPNTVLARVVLADLHAGWNKRAAEIGKQTYGDPEAMAALQLEIDMSRDAEMRAALGEAAFRQWDQENMLRGAHQGRIQLAPSELDAAYILWKRLQQRELELKQARMNAEIDDAGIGEEYGRAIALFERQMKVLLGEQRYAQLQGIDEGTAAADLRHDLAAANPTDAQLRELLKTQQQWADLRTEIDQEFQSDRASADYAELTQQLDEARDAEYRRVLGQDVFDTLQKEQHPGYSLMKRHADLWGLNEDKIESVYGSLKYYEKTVQDYQAEARALAARGEQVDWGAIERDLERFAEQTQQILQSYLGEDSFQKLQQNGVFSFDSNHQLPRGAPLRPEDRQGGS